MMIFIDIFIFIPIQYVIINVYVSDVVEDIIVIVCGDRGFSSFYLLILYDINVALVVVMVVSGNDNNNEGGNVIMVIAPYFIPYRSCIFCTCLLSADGDA